MPDPMSYVQVDLGAFRHNLREIRRRLSRPTRVLVVVKADAYGHGMVRIAREACKAKEVVYLGVSAATEAFTLRKAGIRKAVLILGVVHPDQVREVILQNITASVSSLDEARRLNRAAARLGKKAKVHVELDTGMGRLGVWCGEAIWLLYKVHDLPHLELEGVFTHFPSADEDDPKFSRFQIEAFHKAIDVCHQLFRRPIKCVHMANSMGLVTYRDSHFTLVRPGIMVYGINPARRKLPFRLRSVLSLKSHVSLIKQVERGRSISYARTYVTRRSTRIAVVPIGYSGGYPFRLSGKSRVLIRGEAYPVAGRITMDHLMVDIGNSSRIRMWDEVVLIGKSGKYEIRAEDLAEAAGSIPYEIVCRLSTHLPRVYKA